MRQRRWQPAVCSGNQLGHAIAVKGVRIVFNELVNERCGARSVGPAEKLKLPIRKSCPHFRIFAMVEMLFDHV